MKLTGKTKEDFEKWLYDNDILMGWYSLTESMQYGVYVDWFDSVGIDVELRSPIIGYTDFELEYRFYISRKGFDSFCSIYYKTRPEARTKAIDKANEIYNVQ